MNNNSSLFTDNLTLLKSETSTEIAENKLNHMRFLCWFQLKKFFKYVAANFCPFLVVSFLQTRLTQAQKGVF